MIRLISRFWDQSRNYIWLLAGISGICGLGWLLNSFDPNYLFSIVIFFLLLFVTTFSFSLFITNIVRRSFLISGGVFVFFLLRFLGLRDWYYAFLLIICLIFVELSAQNR